MKRRFFAFDTPIEAFENLSPSILIYWKDTQSLHYGCNDRMAKIYGLERSEVAGVAAQEFMSKEEAEITIANDQQVLNDQTTRSFIEVVQFKTQQEPFTELSIKTVMRDSANQIAGTFGISLILNDRYLQESSLAFQKMNHIGTGSLPLLLLPTEHQSKLTPRERECIYYLIKGKTAKEIANIFNISTRTVEAHLIQIKHKLGCNTRSQIIEKVFKEGIIS